MLPGAHHADPEDQVGRTCRYDAASFVVSPHPSFLEELSKLEIMARIKEAFAKGELGPPEPGAMAYMMSREQYLDDTDPRFQPHLMFYVPNTVNGVDWGGNLPGSPVVVGPQRLPDGAREPLGVFVVPVAHWADGTPAPAPKRP